MAYHETHERNCPRCGQRISATAPKCFNCGRKVPADDEDDEDDVPTNQGGRIGVLLMVAAASLLIAGGVVYLLIRGL